LTITGVLPSTVDYLPYTDNIAAGPVQFFGAQAVRLAVSTAANGDDIWSGTATTLPIPASAGVQMTVVSTSVNDAAAGSGLRTLEMHYVDANGNAQEEILTLNGINPVNTVATNIRFVNDLYAQTAGGTGGAAGTITLYLTGSAATVYTQINIGHYRHSNSARMVPLGKVLLIESYSVSGGSAVGGKSAQINLRSTSHHGLLLPVSPNAVWHKSAIVLVFNSGLDIRFDTPILVPALAVVKCTSFASGAGADIAVNWYGKLISSPV
jgi:hypothetical protein